MQKDKGILQETKTETKNALQVIETTVHKGQVKT